MKTDARVRYTKMRIREAFLRCLRKKPVNKITVKELCELAEINRATFYTHYADPFDLLEKLEEESLEAMRAVLSRRETRGGNLLPHILEGMKESESSYALLASPNGDPGFAAKITELYQEYLAPSVASSLPNASELQQKAAYRFLAGGCGSVVSQWMEDGMQTPAHALADELQVMCERFLLVYSDAIKDAEQNADQA